jgi:hypothetical protein
MLFLTQEYLSGNHEYPVLQPESDYFLSSSGDIPKKARRNWYIFGYKFLSCVNSEWLKCISGTKVKSSINMFRYITTSDEAFARWVLEVKREKIEEEPRQEENVEVKKPFVKKKGVHDSNRFSSRYNEIYKIVKNGRTIENRIIYNNWFWTYFRSLNPVHFSDSPSIPRNKFTENNFKSGQPLLDEAVPVFAAAAATEFYNLDDHDYGEMQAGDPNINQSSISEQQISS